MAYERSTLQYWNGSSWVTAVTAEGSNVNALMAVELVDGLGTPQSCIASLINRSSTPYNSTASNRAGPLTGVFTDFMPIRIMDEESKAIMFYGNVYNVSEKYDRQFGNILEITCRDGLSELRDNPTDGQYGFTINPSGSSVVNPESATDTETRLYTSTISKRSDAIKSLINLNTRWDATNNVSYNIDFSDAERFIPSTATFRDSGELRFGSQSQKSALAHIASLAATDATSLSGGATSTRTAFTYDYYLDPNFQNPSANHKPKAHFNYFKRGTRPNDGSNPEDYGFKVEYGSTTAASGRAESMLDDFDFERPKGELFTDAVVHYTDTGVYNDTADGGKVQTTVQRIVRMELLKIRNIANGTGWTKLKTSPIWEHGTSLASPSSNADYIEAQISGTWTKVARLQYLSADSGGTASSPEYAIISEVATNFPDTAGTTFRHSSGTSSSTFILVGRQSTDFGIRRTFRTSASNATRPDEVREAIAAKIMRGAKQLVRGKFRVLRKPLFYVDNSPTSVSGSSTNQTINLSSTMEPHQYGIRKGMTVNKLSGGQPSEIYGQILSAANGATAANVYWSSGTASSSDTLRYYVPIRAGDLIYVTNDLVGVHGMKMLVTKVFYSEQPGVSSMSIEVVGSESKADGSWAKVSTAAATANSISQSIELPPTQEAQSSAGTSVGGQTFNTNLKILPNSSVASGANRQVKWGSDALKRSQSSASNASITMSGGITCTIVAGGDTDNGNNGPYYLVDSNGSVTTHTILNQDTTYTAFIDFGRAGQEGDKNKTLYLTSDITVPTGDFRVPLAFIKIPQTTGESSDPSIIPFGSGSLTVSKENIAYNSITANEILAGTITSAEITTNSLTGLDIQGATIHTEASLTDGVVISGSLLKIYSGTPQGSGNIGERIQFYDENGSVRTRMRAYNNDDFATNIVNVGSGFMLTYQGGVSGASTGFGFYPQSQQNKAHLGYIFGDYGTESFWGTSNAPDENNDNDWQVYGWGGLILAGALSDSEANTRYLHLLHGGTNNYKITFPSGLPTANKYLKVSSVSNGNATLVWDSATSGSSFDPASSGSIVPAANATQYLGASSPVRGWANLHLGRTANNNPYYVQLSAAPGSGGNTTNYNIQVPAAPSSAQYQAMVTTSTYGTTSRLGWETIVRPQDLQYYGAIHLEGSTSTHVIPIGDGENLQLGVTGDLSLTFVNSGSAGGDIIRINHDNSGVSAGSYTNSDLTVDARGHITAISDGSSSGYSHPDPIRLANGSNSAPTYSFSGATNTGMYKS